MTSINADDRSSCLSSGFHCDFSLAMREYIAAGNAERGHRENDRSAAEDFFHACFHLCHLIRKIWFRCMRNAAGICRYLIRKSEIQKRPADAGLFSVWDAVGNQFFFQIAYSVTLLYHETEQHPLPPFALLVIVPVLCSLLIL